MCPFPNTILVPLQFSGGLNSKIPEFSLDQPYLQSLQNGTYNQIGQVDKRSGFICVSTKIQGGGNIDSGATITTFNNELLLLDGTTLYSYQPEEDVWISRGAIFPTSNRQIKIISTKTATQSGPDCTSANHISLYAWEDNRVSPTTAAGVRYTVINNQTNTVIVYDKQVYAFGTRPKVITDGTTFYLFYVASTDTILYDTIPVARPNTVSSHANILEQDGYSQDGYSPAIPYDACMFGSAPLVAYASTTGVRFSKNHFLISANTQVNTIGMCVDSNNVVWVAFSDHTDTYISAFRFNLFINNWTTVLAPQVVNSFVSQVSVNLALIEGKDLGSLNLTTEIAQSGNNNYCNNYVVTTNGVSTFIGQMRGEGLASKPFKLGRDIFINTIAQSNLQSTYFTHCLTQGSNFQSGTANIQAGINGALATNFLIVSKHSPTTGGTYRTNSLLSQCDIMGANNFIFAGQRKGPFTSFQNAQQVNLGVAGYSIQFKTANAFNNVQANNNLHIVGGIKKIYDGVSVVEDNYNLFPENADGYGCKIVNVVVVDGYNQIQSTVPGNLTYNPLTQPNQYQWLVVYEWTDNANQVQRSCPSVPITAVTSASGQGVDLVGPMLRLTEKVNPRSPVIISIYRTQDSLPIFYKITDDSNPLVNDPTVDTWTARDTLSDLDIAANENLYTGSQLANNAPPPCDLISLLSNRLIINSTEDPGVLWYSQNKFEQDQYNTLALDWNSSFVKGVSSRFGDDITAIGLLDNQLAIFKETSIFILSGDGPNALLTSGQFNDAAPLVADTGCTNQNSLVFITQTPTLPGGLLFKSAKGIYLLGRDETLHYIGAPVEKYNNLTITSANLLTKTNQVVFTTLEGTALVYNYFFNAWSTWENLPAVSACIWQDQLVLLQSDGSVLLQDTTGTVFSDTRPNGVVEPVKLFVTTPWIKLNGLQGYQSVYNVMLLGTLQGPHTLQVQVEYDYNPSIEGAVLIDSSIASNRWGGLPIWGSQGAWGNQGIFSNYQFQINLNNPRCEAIRLTISDVNNLTYSQGFSLNGLVLECLALPGPMRVPTSNKVGIE